jgi:hypothetical protein
MTRSTLRDVIRRIDEFDEQSDGLTIWLEGPSESWSPDSEAIVAEQVPDDPTGLTPPQPGFTYQLEIFIAKDEVLSQFPGAGLEERCERVIEYGRFDAFPSLVDGPLPP